MYDKSPSTNIQIDETSQELIDLTLIPKLDLKKVEQLINEIINKPNSSGLAVFLASELLWQIPNLRPELAEKICSMKTQIVKDDPLIGELDLRKGALLCELDEFCQQTKRATSYFQPEPVKHPQINQILGLICQQTAARYQSHYQNNPNFVFEVYSHPKRQIPGVWMSQNNQHFTPDEFLRMEQADEVIFAATYRQPALPITKKNITYVQ